MEEKIMNDQPTLNIGTIGHVAHGKSTLVSAITKVKTIKFRSELERNITIKLGYANAKIYKCNKCPRPQCYQAFNSTSPKTMECKCLGTLTLVKHVSFVDCPGHDVLMATMLNGTAIMDAAILLIAANEPCPQPQTQEHLFAVEIMQLNRFIIIQNKIDLVTREQALEQYDSIQEFLQTTTANKSPVVPTSSQLGVNISAVLDFIVNYIPTPVRSLKERLKMVIIRSFDTNKPGTPISEIKGGVIGGSLVSGKLNLGDKIEIRPGFIYKTKERIICKPYVTVVCQLKSENNKLEEAYPGGLIGVETQLDPSLCKSNKLVGQVMGKFGELPHIYSAVIIDFTLFQKIVVQSKECIVEPLKLKEKLFLNIGSANTGAIITSLEGSRVNFKLFYPACCDKNERIAISRKLGGNWRLIGYGTVFDGKPIIPDYNYVISETPEK
ncbi:unnamed protein product [Dimorphilus gyrociliatus]|uniref:protein-synthesizing GTPase n=1 Tax=Dimorphilus gyrociliatus TaxID=2664684 RepID=A0A7I8WFI1_9ANNE|nr:unnamed protein product [Dimorphilus gyrociliatus]